MEKRLFCSGCCCWPRLEKRLPCWGCICCCWLEFEYKLPCGGFPNVPNVLLCCCCWPKCPNILLDCGSCCCCAGWPRIPGFPRLLKRPPCWGCCCPPSTLPPWLWPAVLLVPEKRLPCWFVERKGLGLGWPNEENEVGFCWVWPSPLNDDGFCCCWVA